MVIFTKTICNVEYNKIIERNPGILQGKPIIKGTRISVELIVRKIAGGFTINDILLSYPHLSIQQISAALEYAADLIANEEVEEFFSPKLLHRRA